MVYIILALLILIAGVFLYTHKVLGGENLSQYDRNDPVTFKVPEKPEGIERLNAYLDVAFRMPAQSAKASTGWESKRERFDAAGVARDFECEFRRDRFDANGVTIDGAWTLVEGADPDKRILYLHGGAMTVGSDLSHRALTYNIAKRTGCAVFAANYRLMPENPRQATIDDSCAAYKWILENGPDGPARAEKIGVAGDSAGGNLTLMVSHWTREANIRRPDAVVGLSAHTDATASGPSMKGNLHTDLMLTPLLKDVLKIPRIFLLWGMRKALGINPSDPQVSPIFADLSDLPPTLLQASASEMLYDDSVRYAAKAKAQGSDVIFQSWNHLPHVWQIFDDYVQEAHHALDEIGDFFKKNGFIGK